MAFMTTKGTATDFITPDKTIESVHHKVIPWRSKMPNTAHNRLWIIALALLLFTTGCSRYAVEMIRDNKLRHQPQLSPNHSPRPQTWRNDEVTWSWLGHASVLINLQGSWIITDPVLFDRIGPPEAFDNAFGIRRITRLPLEPDRLPAIGTILISHAHYDHLDLPSLKFLASKNSLVVAPANTTRLLKDFSSTVIELDWQAGKQRYLKRPDGVEITAFRVEHYGFFPLGKRKAPSGFNGYLIEKNGIRIVFLGDTSFQRHRNAQGFLLKNPQAVDWSKKLDGRRNDLCIIPIGDSYYRKNHISPAEAITIAEAMRCDNILPIHYNTFILTPPNKAVENPQAVLAGILRQRAEQHRLQCANDNGQSLPLAEIGATCIFRKSRQSHWQQ